MGSEMYILLGFSFMHGSVLSRGWPGLDLALGVRENLQGRNGLEGARGAAERPERRLVGRPRQKCWGLN